MSYVKKSECIEVKDKELEEVQGGRYVAPSKPTKDDKQKTESASKSFIGTHRP